MPKITRILETALYVDEVAAVIAFYRDKLGFPVIAGDGGRLTALDAGGATVLLVFQRGGSTQGVEIPGGFVPPCDGQGPTHLAFAIGADEFDHWEKELVERGVPIESRVRWERGGAEPVRARPGWKLGGAGHSGGVEHLLAPRVRSGN